MFAGSDRYPFIEALHIHHKEHCSYNGYRDEAADSITSYLNVDDVICRNKTNLLKLY